MGYQMDLPGLVSHRWHEPSDKPQRCRGPLHLNLSLRFRWPSHLAQAWAVQCWYRFLLLAVAEAAACEARWLWRRLREGAAMAWDGSASVVMMVVVFIDVGCFSDVRFKFL